MGPMCTRVLFFLCLGVSVLGANCAPEPWHPLKPPANAMAPVAVYALDAGSIRLQRGSRKRVLDLAGDISGCRGRLYDPTTNEEFAGGVEFELVDEIERLPYTYVVLLASAPPNCNVQGHCGAGGLDSTLIWLKLTQDLALAGKQASVIADCRGNLSSNVPTEEDPENEFFETIQAKDLPWKGDVLQIELQDWEERPIGHLIYDRQNPAAGLQRLP